jgi:hypothetical protein
MKVVIACLDLFEKGHPMSTIVTDIRLPRLPSGCTILDDYLTYRKRKPILQEPVVTVYRIQLSLKSAQIKLRGYSLA